MKKLDKEKIYKYGVFLLYLGVSFLLVFMHESWEDEAQAWLISRDLNIVEIIKMMKYEGHSCLWHLILLPFAKLGFPYETIKIISWLISAVTAYLILDKSPFKKITKILILFNPLMIYILPAISRPYCLMALFLVVLSILYKDKEKHPYLYGLFLALLANTHVIMLPMTGMLIVTFYFDKLIIKRKIINNEERKKYIKGSLIALFGIIICLLQTITSIENSTIVDATNSYSSLSNFNDAFSRIVEALNILAIDLCGDYIIGKVFLVISIIFVILASIKNKRQALVFWPTVIIFIFIHVFIMINNYQRTMVLLLLIIFWAWNCKDDNIDLKDTKFIKIAFLLLLSVTMLRYELIYSDIKYQFSSGKQTAQYIEDNIPVNSYFICDDSDTAKAIIPYLKEGDYYFYDYKSSRLFTYNIWDEAWYSSVTLDKLMWSIFELRSNGIQNIYVINTRSKIYIPEYSSFNKIYSSENVKTTVWMFDEAYDIYELEF